MPPRKKPPIVRAAAPAAASGFAIHLQPFLRYLEAECGMSPNTVAAYRSDLSQFLAWCGARNARLRDADLKFLAKYLDHLHGRQLAAATVARQLVSIKMFFRFLVLEGALLESAVELMNSPKLWQHLPKILSPEKVNELLAAPTPDDAYPLRDRALLSMLYATGCRASEVASLRLRDVNLSEGYCRATGKGNKERMVSLNPSAIAAVEAYLAHERPALARNGGDDWLFLSRSGNRLSRIMVWNLVKKYAARIGCSRDVSPHTFRHSFATHMLAGGAEIRALQEILGHASIRTTQIYTQVEHSRLKAIHKKHHPRG
jgi:integrase/recombinase XerD